MGRTRPTLRDRIDRLEQEWQPFRRSLRRRHQGAFDGLFERARAHADAATQQNPADPWQAFVMAVLLAQERELRAVRDVVESMENGVDEEPTAGDSPQEDDT